MQHHFLLCCQQETHRRFPLLWFDEEKGENRALRYARNQKSPFEDEQDGNAIVEPVIFEDGFLRVPRSKSSYYSNFYIIILIMVTSLLK